MKAGRQHLITALVQNETGTLNRLTSLFRRRGFSMASLNAGDCEQVGYSRLTLVVNGDQSTMSQCVRQMERLIDVVEVQDLPPQRALMRELALVKVSAPRPKLGEIVEIVRILGGKVASISHDTVTAELSDEPAKIEHFVSMLSPYGIRQTVRTGLVAMQAD